MLSILALLLVTAHNLQAASVTKKTVNMDYIIFPGEDHMTRLDPKPAKLQDGLSNKFGELDVHESCKRKTYCTIKPPNYPEEKFNEMFKDYKIPPMPTFDVLGNRQGNTDLVNDCETTVTYEPLYVVREKREDEWRTVVQAPKRDFIQRIRLETCESAGSSCFKPFLEDNKSYVTECLQMVEKWEIMVAKLDSNGTEIITSKLPVCCSCKYRQIDFLTRFNVDAGKESKSKKNKA